MFNSNGYLPAGFHDWNIKEVQDRLVLAFPASGTRAGNFAGFEKLRTEMAAVGYVVEQWIDGSFSTSKVDPGDIDLLNVMDIADAASVTPIQASVLNKLVAGKVTRATHKCDSYFMISVTDQSHPEYEFWRERRKYWMGEFGFDRKDVPKGIVRTQLAPDGPIVSGTALPTGPP